MELSCYGWNLELFSYYSQLLTRVVIPLKSSSWSFIFFFAKNKKLFYGLNQNFLGFLWAYKLLLSDHKVVRLVWKIFIQVFRQNKETEKFRNFFLAFTWKHFSLWNHKTAKSLEKTLNFVSFSNVMNFNSSIKNYTIKEFVRNNNLDEISHYTRILWSFFFRIRSKPMTRM